MFYVQGNLCNKKNITDNGSTDNKLFVIGIKFP